MTATFTQTTTYTTTDIEVVHRRFAADLHMIAEATATLTPAAVSEYLADILLLAKNGYLAYVDVTLLQANQEHAAARYVIDTKNSEPRSARPGGAPWPRLPGGHLRIILGYTSRWANRDASEDARLRRLLKISWQPTATDVSHATLSRSGERKYVSQGYGATREDFC